MERKLNCLFYQCVEELNSIGIDVNNNPNIGLIDITISRRNNKRYGCCKQEEPDIKTKYIEKLGKKRITKYARFNKHHIEISPWIMGLDESIKKNTIMHEIIHCFPFCNNHGKDFKKYANYINDKLGYDISRVGDKKEDFFKSNISYSEDELFNYHIQCVNCRYSFYRKRLVKNFVSKFRCGYCGFASSSLASFFVQ